MCVQGSLMCLNSWGRKELDTWTKQQQGFLYYVMITVS